MWHRVSRFNTLRNQMLFGFLLGMLLILSMVGIVIFNSVSSLLKNNAEKHIQQTAVQANGRLEAVLTQIDSLSTQVATNVYVQRLLLNELSGHPASFMERQALLPIVNIVQTYASGITSVELYTSVNKRLFPLDGDRLESKISQEWINKAQEKQGGILWIGMNPTEPNSLLAIRRVSLMDEGFTSGGYLLVRMDRSVLNIGESSDEGVRESMLLVGMDYNIIASNNPEITKSDIQSLLENESQTVTVNNLQYIIVKQHSAISSWTLLILTPISAVTQGISVLRSAIFVPAALGTLLFFLFAFLLSTLIIRPILRLIKTMRSTRFGMLKPTVLISSTIEINELNHTYNQMVNNINQLIQQVYEREILQTRTELKALQAQINPHFLFNTLEALYWSLREKDDDELAEFVVAMSDLFRYTITGSSKEEWVTLGEELEHVERYLLIMKIRFGERLTWNITLPSELATFRVPKLLIQPIVENAILHGIENKIGPGTVRVAVSRGVDKDMLKITVEDDGGGMDHDTLQRVEHSLSFGKSSSSKGSGLGITNVQQRIKLYFAGVKGASGRVLIRSHKGKGTVIDITIPIITEVPDESEQNDFNR